MFQSLLCLAKKICLTPGLINLHLLVVGVYNIENCLLKCANTEMFKAITEVDRSLLYINYEKCRMKNTTLRYSRSNRKEI